MGKWGKWVFLFVVAIVFAVPAWAVDLKLGGKYEIQGRYYHEKDIYSVKESGNDTTPCTTMYLKHYFSLYPELVVNDKISVKADIEAFNNIISRADSRGWYDKVSGNYKTSVGTPETFDAFSLFTINELYVDATTQVGKFVVGKTKGFDGIGWFIKTDNVPDWVFGLVWNKKDEGANSASYLGYTAKTDTTSAVDGSDSAGTVTTHDNGDIDEFMLVANYAKDAIDFKGNLAYKKSGHSHTRINIIYPFAYFNYAVTKDIRFNSKFGFATGTLISKNSNYAKVASSRYAALYPNGFKKDIECDKPFGIWVGMGYTIDTIKLQGDLVYLKAADAPNKISAYLEDSESLDSWLMNDQLDTYSPQLETPSTIAALGDPNTDNNFSYAGNIMARFNIATKVSSKVDTNLNLLYAQKENVDYQKKWNLAYARSLNLIDPDAMKVGGTGIASVAAPTNEYNVSKKLGLEMRWRMNYAMQENLTFGLDVAMFMPGKFLKDYLENNKAFVNSDAAVTSLYKVENVYAARWKATVKF